MVCVVVSEDPFGPGDTYPIIPDSAAFLAQPAASSAKAWVQTGAGIATVVICCILGLALLGGLVALGLYMFARKETITIPESGPDVRSLQLIGEGYLTFFAIRLFRFSTFFSQGNF